MLLFIVRMHLGMQKNNYQHNGCFLYFLKKYLHPIMDSSLFTIHDTMHFRAKKIKIRFVTHSYNYQNHMLLSLNIFKIHEKEDTRVSSLSVGVSVLRKLLENIQGHLIFRYKDICINFRKSSCPIK